MDRIRIRYETVKTDNRDPWTGNWNHNLDLYPLLHHLFLFLLYSSARLRKQWYESAIIKVERQKTIPFHIHELFSAASYGI